MACRNVLVESRFLKAYPANISANQLSELTGRDRRTIKERLKRLTPVEEGSQGALYDIRAAIRMIFDFNPDDESQKIDFENDFQPVHEKAKLDFIRRQDLELDLQVKQRNLIPKEEIKSGLQKIFGSIRAKLLYLPTKAAQQIQNASSQKETEALIRGIVDEALMELSEGAFDD